MKRTIQLTLVVLIVFVVALSAQAQASRTWVSGVGDDVNPCSRTAPCKTWAGAISKTQAFGVINALDPGGFGTLNITKSITIDGTGPAASALNAGVNGFIINAGNADIVTLRNVDVHGALTPGADGVRILNAKAVFLENVRIQGQTSNGIEVASGANPISVNIRNSQILDTASWGIFINSGGGGLVKMTVENTHVSNCGGVGAGGIDVAGANHSLTLSRSVITNNTAAGVQVEQGTPTVVIADSVISYNATGIQAGVAGNAPIIRVRGCTISSNSTAAIAGTGTVVGVGGGNMVFNNAGTNVQNSLSSSVAGQ